MRKIPAVLAVLGLSALALAGCAAHGAGGSAAACERSESNSTALDLVKVAGDAGQPTATLTAPVYTDSTVYTDLTVGDGLPVTTRAQDVSFAVTIVNGATGQTVTSAQSDVRTVTEWGSFYEGIAKMLDCATEGSRIVGAVAPDDLSPDARAGIGLEDGDSAVIILDLNKVFLPAANGVPQYVDGSGIPTVVLAPDGRPGIVVPDAAPPTDLVVKTLKKGDGEVVEAGSTPRVHYTGVLWETGEVFDSSWENGASVPLSLEGVVPGFAQALEGQTVGSQVIAVIPPELGYGDQAQGAIPAGSTLVFVIDILGMDVAPPATQ
ncbi:MULTISPECIES: FKBP-type peptidyl-prolyl cis-trans isomerase [unclassified Microbacterium]|uniref:FKBP-type peptidyl-prolyl cis-trans isomerase n=1 Tax=unclassified Microbacterium TaxID=2609290 RepID=UPI00386AD6BA